MNRPLNHLFISIIIICTVSPNKIWGQNNIAETENKRFVTIKLEFSELGESTKMLNNAISKLSKTIDKVSEKPDQMTPQQIEAVAILARETNNLVATFGQSMKEITPRLEGLKQPTTELVSEWVNAARQQGIDPAIRSIDSAVSTWIRVIIIGLIMILVILGVALYLSMGHLRQATDNLRKIAGEYTIVRTDSLKNQE